MFGKHGLLKDGAEAKAIVTSVDLYQDGMRANWGTGFTYDVGLRVHFGDDTKAEIVRRIGGMSGTDLKFTVGDIVPVRYDPGHHDRVELDQAALRAQQHDSREALQRRVAKADQEAVREAEAKLTGSTPQMPAAAADPETEKLDALMKLDELHTSGAITDTEFKAAVTKLENG